MQSPSSDIVPCTYLERVVPLPVAAVVRAFDELVQDLQVSAAPDGAELRLGSGVTTFDIRHRSGDSTDHLICRVLPVRIRSGLVHRHDAAIEVGPWSSTESVVGLRVHLRRAPRVTDAGWHSYRAAGVELLTAVAANVVRLDAAERAARTIAVA